MGTRRLVTRVWVFVASLSLATAANAIGPENVLVLYNSASQEGLDIANYYAQVHPGVQLLGLSGVSSSEQITASEYLNTILGPVRSALTPSTQVIVTTKGLPLRIYVDEPKPPGTPPSYTDINGVNHVISTWRNYSSLESELAAIDKIGSTDPSPQMQTASRQMMGDQSYSQTNHFASNPYFNTFEDPGTDLIPKSFSHADTGTRLTARLDAFTVDDVMASIDRAQNAFIGPQNTPAGPLHFLIDNDPVKSTSGVMANLVNNVLVPAGLPVTYDNTAAFVGTTTGPVMGYVSYGANQGSTPLFVPGEGSYIVNGLNFTPANGAVFHTWESYNAESFVEFNNHGNQGLVGEWLAKGGTVATGHVAEPYSSWSTVTNEDMMFRMLLEGKTWAEAAWWATRQVSYVNTVVGDPLMTWKQLLPGDATMDGVVDMYDLAAIGAHWGSSVSGGGYGWYSGDLNGDGVVDVLDLSIMGSTWGQVSSWASGQPMGGGITAQQFAELFSDDEQTIPEPSSWILLALGIGSLAACGLRRRRRRVAAK